MSAAGVSNSKVTVVAAGATETSAIADLAFGALFPSDAAAGVSHRHLALFATESLELDLTDPAQRQFGDYELLELIGEGGMGVVYRAHQKSLDREVAVKLLAAGPWASFEFIERFRREAQNAARMQHPNIVAIYEVGSTEEMHFFSMRLVRGGSLAERIARDGPFTPIAAARLLRTIAEAVDYAHRLDVLHLDLKPANVLLDETGAPHVADFGLARRLDAALAVEGNEISGTPSYMAPEQAAPQNASITRATDIWGLGAILYESITGIPPFHAGSPRATLRLVVTGSLRSPRDVAQALPHDMEAIVLKCLSPQPAERYASARMLADDLGRFIDGRAVLARPLNAMQRVLRWTRREPKAAVAALCAFAALLIGLAATTHQWSRAEHNAKLAVANAGLANERLWQTRLDQAASALRDDHPFAALPGLAATIAERETLDLDAQEDRLRFAMISRSAPQLTDVIALGSGVTGVGLSPDGRFAVAATLDSTLHLFDTATGVEKWNGEITGVPFVFTKKPKLDVVRFSPDGRRIVGYEHWGGPQIDIASPVGEFEVLFDTASGKQLLPPKEKFPRYYDAVFSADGEYAIVQSEDDTTSFVRTSDWSALSASVPMPRSTWRIGNGGRHLVSQANNFLTLQVRDARTLQVRRRYDYPPAQFISAWATSPDGNSLLIGHADGTMEWFDLEHDTRERVLPGALSRIGWVAFSADGRWFGAVSDTGEVLVWDSSTHQPAIPLLHLEAGLGRHRQQLLLDHENHRVLASNGAEMALWSVSADATRRVTGEFPHALPRLLRAFDLAGADRVASGGDEGELRLWRLPRSMPTLTAPANPDSVLLAPDGEVVTVDANRIQIARARDASAVSAAITLPQSPSFAERTLDTHTLVVVVGRLLHVYDMPDATVRFPPIAIVNDPARVVLSPDSRHVFVAYGAYRGDTAVDVARVWDLFSGRPVSDEIDLPPCDAIEFAPDARSLLTCGALRDANSLQVLWTTSVNPPLQVAWMHFAVDASEVLALANDAAADENYLLRLGIRNGAERERRRLSGVRGAGNFAMLPGSSMILERGDEQGPVVWRDGHVAGVGDAHAIEERNVFAPAPDARTFARGTAHGIALTSARDGRWIARELFAGLADDDFTQQVAYTRDGRGLVARSSYGCWLYWDTSPDARSARELLRIADLLHPDADALPQHISPPLTAAERADLRRADPGPAQSWSSSDRFTIPSRQEGLSSLLFDLSARYNRPLLSEKNQGEPFRLNAAQFVPGVHRLLGVDYDARGQIELSQSEASGGPPIRVDGIRPGVPYFAALDVLITATTMLRTQDQVPYAFVDLEYRDGSHARLPIVYNRDIKEWWRTDWTTPGRIAWRLRDYGTGDDSPEQYPSMVAVRLVNPHPERDVASIALEAVRMQFSSPAILAITAEPRTE